MRAREIVLVTGAPTNDGNWVRRMFVEHDDKTLEPPVFFVDEVTRFGAAEYDALQAHADTEHAMRKERLEDRKPLQRDPKEPERLGVTNRKARRRAAALKRREGDDNGG
jgi:hypothetical protein